MIYPVHARAIERGVKKVGKKLCDFLNLKPKLSLAYSRSGFANSAIRGRAGYDVLDSCKTMHFNVGTYPRMFSPSRIIVEWGEVDVKEPGKEVKNRDRIRKRVITIKRAQREVERLLNQKDACHEYLAYEAAKLCNHPLAIKYTLHIMLGAKAEDYVFMPNEKLDDLYAKKSHIKRPRSNIEFANIMVPKDEWDKLSFYERAFSKIAKLWHKLTNSIESDLVNRPYMAHFYDPTRPGIYKGLSVIDNNIIFQSALDRIKKYWKLATVYYLEGHTGRAFYALGHIVHLISDLHVPAHVHNDIHGPTFIFGKLDSLEQWLARTDYPHLQRAEGHMNITIWDSGPRSCPSPDITWNEDNIYTKLDEFVDSIVVKTQEFRSVDAFGTAPDQKRKGKLDVAECVSQARVLIPRAITNSAQIIANFISYCERANSKNVG